MIAHRRDWDPIFTSQEKADHDYVLDLLDRLVCHILDEEEAQEGLDGDHSVTDDETKLQ